MHDEALDPEVVGDGLDGEQSRGKRVDALGHHAEKLAHCHFWLVDDMRHDLVELAACDGGSRLLGRQPRVANLAHGARRASDA